jgi:hypothetical protein
MRGVVSFPAFLNSYFYNIIFRIKNNAFIIPNRFKNRLYEV